MSVAWTLKAARTPLAFQHGSPPRMERSIASSKVLPDTLLSARAGVLRTHAWLERCDVLRLCACQKAAYHARDALDAAACGRLLARLGGGRYLPCPSGVLEDVARKVGARQVNRKQRDSADRRQERWRAMPQHTQGLVVLTLTCRHELTLRDRHASSKATGESVPLPEGRCFVRFVSAVPSPHVYHEMHLPITN